MSATGDEAPRISLVIPAHNEEAYLPHLLDTVEAARAQYRGGADAVEVIVVDNASTDRTAELARARGHRVVREDRRVIAAVRNAGARAALGEILCFVDADMRIHPDTFDVIERALASGRLIAGATGVRPERWSVGIAITWMILVPLLYLMNMDTGVVFCRRSDFEAIGGYDESLLLAEDVKFLFDLRRRGRRNGQRVVRVRGVKAVTSMRKFDQHGDWHYFPMLWKGIRAFISRRGGLEAFAAMYWYGEQRRSGLDGSLRNR